MPLTQPRPPIARVRYVRTTRLDVLLVDDDEATQIAVAELLHDAAHRVTVAGDAIGAIAVARDRVFDVVICDVGQRKADALRLFQRLRRDSPTTAVILTTSCGVVPDAVEALRSGACDYLTKPFDAEALSHHINRIAEHLALKRPLEELRTQAVSRAVGGTIIGHSPAMLRLGRQIDAFAPSDAPVVISGEIGTGKELVARTIHGRGPRRNRPFVSVDCTMSAAQLGPELFGEARGAANPANARDGAFRLAHGGTLLLRNVDAVARSVRAELRRVLETRTIELPCSGRVVPVDVRVLGTTRCSLDELAGARRSDRELWSDLKVLELTMPPLRERRGDIALLVDYFLRRAAPAGVDPCRVSRRAWSALVAHSYPGNVRELIDALERALKLACGSEIDREHLPPEMPRRALPAEAQFSSLSEAAREFEKAYLTRAVATCDRASLAERLGLSRATLRAKLHWHGIRYADADRRESRR